MEGSGRDLFEGTITQLTRRHKERTRKIINQDGRTMGKEVNHGLPENEIGVLITKP
jgi:hypothetical protein